MNPSRRPRRAVVVLLAVMTLAAAAAGVATDPLGAAPAPAFRQSGGASAIGTTSAAARLAATTAGSTIVACVGADSPAVTVGDDQGNRYLPAGSVPNSSGAGVLHVFYSRNARAGVTEVQVTHPWGHSDIVAAEYAPTGALDRFAALDSGYDQGSGWSSGATARTRAPDELVVGCGFEVYGADIPVSFSAGAGFAGRASQRGLFLQDRTQRARATVTADGERLPHDRLNVIAAVATFRPGPATPPPPPPPPTTASTTTSSTLPTTSIAPPPPPSTSVPPLPPTSVPPPPPTSTPPTSTPPPPAPGAVEVLFTDVTSGPTSGGPDGLGAPIAVYGIGFGPVRGDATVTIGGIEVARYLVWGQGNAHNPDLDMIVVQPGPAVAGGRVVVTVAGRSSTADIGFTATPTRILVLAPTGSDAADCSLAAPCATLSEILTQRARPGDIVLMRGGTYHESEVWVRADHGHSGSPGRQKVVKAFPGESVVLDNGARPFIVDADHVTVAGLKFRNGKSLGIPDTGLPGHRGNRFIDNTFTGVIQWGAVDTHGDDHEVAGNVCDVSGSVVGTQGHCYYISYGSGVRLRYNVGRGAPGYGIHVFDQQRSALDFRRTITDLLIEGNTLTGSTLRSGLILAMADEGGRGNVIDGVTVRGNRFAANAHLGMLVAGQVRNVTVTGNTFDQNGRQGLHIASDAGVSGVAVTANRFVQSANAVCPQDCSWYTVAHLQVGPAASGVIVNANRYEPPPPVILGVTDPAPR